MWYLEASAGKPAEARYAQLSCGNAPAGDAGGRTETDGVIDGGGNLSVKLPEAPEEPKWSLRSQ